MRGSQYPPTTSPSSSSSNTNLHANKRRNPTGSVGYPVIFDDLQEYAATQYSAKQSNRQQHWCQPQNNFNDSRLTSIDHKPLPSSRLPPSSTRNSQRQRRTISSDTLLLDLPNDALVTQLVSHPYFERIPSPPFCIHPTETLPTEVDETQKPQTETHTSLPSTPRKPDVSGQEEGKKAAQYNATSSSVPHSHFDWDDGAQKPFSNRDGTAKSRSKERKRRERAADGITAQRSPLSQNCIQFLKKISFREGRKRSI